MGTGFVDRGKGHDEYAAGFLVEGIEIDGVFGNTHAGYEIVDGIGLSMGNGDAVFHTGGHLAFAVKDAGAGSRFIFYFSCLDEDIKQFVNYCLFGGSLKVKIDSVGSQYSFEVHVVSLRSFIGKVKDFIYNRNMTDIDKFFSDADRLVARASVPGSTTAAKLGSELSRMFLVWTRDYGDIGTDLAAYWTERYGNTLTTDAGRKSALDWFGAALALLSGCFGDTMNFTDEDWEEIRDIVSAEAENLDMDLLVSIMTIIVERGKA